MTAVQGQAQAAAGQAQAAGNVTAAQGLAAAGQAQAAVRQAHVQQRVDQLCAAAIRAVSGDPGVHVRGRRLFRGGRRLAVRAPHLHPDPSTDDLGSFRGAADAVALRLRWSDLAAHERRCPADPTARLLFDLLEQYRVESLADPAMPGLAANLRHRHRQWSLAFHRSGLTQTETGLLLFATAQLCRARICGDPYLHEAEALLESPRFTLAPVIGGHVAAMAASRHDQARYADHALAVALAVRAMLPEAGVFGPGDEPPSADPAAPPFTLFADLDGDDTPGGGDQAGADPAAGGGGGGYRVFTTVYDRVAPAAAGLRPELVERYRQHLDTLVARQGIDLGRVCRQLLAVHPEPVTGGWESDREEGHVDGRLLGRLVTAPGEARIFRVERHEPVADLDVTILVDCSGSMKEHAEAVAVLVDVLSRALDLVGARSEVLGFTTGAWNGGRAWHDWLRAGRPRHPGRLTEVDHLVFQESGTPWRRARRPIATLLHLERYRESVDGEAVSWAAGRAAARGASGAVLLVVSDGSPMDSATALTNGDAYIEDHLAAVVADIEAGGDIAVGAVGTRADLTPWYRHSRVLDLSRGVRNTVMDDVLDVLRLARR